MPSADSNTLVQIVQAVLDFVSKIVADIDDGNYVGAGIRCCICGEVFLFGMFFGVLIAFWIEDTVGLLWMIGISIVVLTVLLLLLLVRMPMDDSLLSRNHANRASKIGATPIT